jgi:hypothetical protein
VSSSNPEKLSTSEGFDVLDTPIGIGGQKHILGKDHHKTNKGLLEYCLPIVCNI